MHNEHQPPLPRIAAHIHTALNRSMRQDTYVDSLTRLVDQAAEITRHAKRLRICRCRGWHAAEWCERLTLSRRLCDLEAAIRTLTFDFSRSATIVASLGTILDDLREIEDEFGPVRFDRHESCLSVTTEPIVLEDIALDRFELRISLSKLARGDALDALRVIALAPNPCTADDAITHPHVNSERVCLGEAAAAFQSALEAGRIADALLLVRSVLHTYNASSPFCALASWYGRTCSDCGYNANGDDCYWCERCQQDFCDECFTACLACGTSSCSGCLCTCKLCDEQVCGECLSRCTRCDERACPSCLDNGLCPACIETLNNSDEENTDHGAFQDQHEIEAAAGPKREPHAAPQLVGATA
jgi:hypothetical protein